MITTCDIYCIPHYNIIIVIVDYSGRTFSPLCGSVKEEINSCMLALQRLRDDIKTRQGELAVRNVKMVDQEVEAKLLALKKTILEEQSSKLSQEKQILMAKLVQ